MTVQTKHYLLLSALLVVTGGVTSCTSATPTPQPKVDTPDALQYPWDVPTEVPAQASDPQLVVTAAATWFLSDGTWMRDVWVISNPTLELLSFKADLRVRDANGLFLGQDEFGCPQRGSSWGVVEGELIWIPPGGSFLVSSDIGPAAGSWLYRGDVRGVSQVLSITTLTSCSNADFFAKYDPDVVLASPLDNRASGINGIIQNQGSRTAAAGVLYANVYERSSEIPFWGGSVGTIDHGRPIPPGEKVEREFSYDYINRAFPRDFDLDSEVFVRTAENESSLIWGNAAGRFEYVLVGMSE